MTGPRVGRLDEEAGKGVASAEDSITFSPVPEPVGPSHAYLFFLVKHGPPVSLAMQVIVSASEVANRANRCT